MLLLLLLSESIFPVSKKKLKVSPPHNIYSTSSFDINSIGCLHQPNSLVTVKNICCNSTTLVQTGHLGPCHFMFLFQLWMYFVSSIWPFCLSFETTTSVSIQYQVDKLIRRIWRNCITIKWTWKTKSFWNNREMAIDFLKITLRNEYKLFSTSTYLVTLITDKSESSKTKLTMAELQIVKITLQNLNLVNCAC